MAGGSGRKNYKGQDQVVQGSPTGEYLVITRFDYDNSCGDPKYIGEAKIGSAEIDSKWHIELLEYDSVGNLVVIKTATNQILTGSTEITIDPTYGTAEQTLLTLADGTFHEHYVKPGDYIKLDTALNFIRNAEIQEVLSDTQVVIKAVGVSEVSAALDPEDLIITLQNELTKDYAKRRWDLRALYIYL